MKKSSIRFTAGVIAAFLIAVPFAATGSYAATPSAGIIVPLYTYPGSTWASVVETKRAHSDVPIVAIVNPSSGPGASKDPNYVSGIETLKSAGVTVIGYVSTAYAGRALSAVKADIDKWKSWYPSVDGIFFDEQTNWPGQEWYYSQADSYANSKGLAFTVGNPGANSLPSYLDTVDVVLVYESPGLPDLANYQSWSSADNRKLGMIPFAVGSMPRQWIEDATSIVGWVYVTSDQLPNPWDSLPSYFEGMAEFLDNGIGTLPPPSPNKYTLSINSVDQYGTSTPGMWIEVRESGTTVSTGFTPLSVSLEGSVYTVTASNYGKIIFDRWSDGTESNSVSVSLSSSKSLTAHYNNGDLVAPLSAALAVDKESAPAGSTITFGNQASGGTSPYTWSVNFGDGTSSSYSWARSVSKEYSSPGTYRVVSTVRDSTGRTDLSSPVTVTITPAGYSLAVKTVDSSGGPLTGYYTTVSQGGSQIKSGFSPATFWLKSGQSYQISVADYGGYVFSRWDDGSTSRTRTIYSDGGSKVTVTAYYSTGPSEVNLRVKTAALDGSPITGLWTVIDGDGSRSTGFSPVSYQATAGDAYSVTVADYGNYVFDHWDNGSKSRTRVVEPYGDKVIVAYYRK